MMNRDSLICDNTKYCILLAEDDFANAEYVKLALRKLNVSIYHAQDGAQAVDYFKTNQPIDLIIMDIKMPIMDGYIATKLIRELDCDVPIVAFTAFALDNDKEKAMSAGCTDYITKPVSKDHLISTISKYLEKKHLLN